MIKQIKKELDEIKNHQEHMDFVPENLSNPKENFDEIVKLTTRTNSRFKVNGDYKKFVIQSKSDNIMFGVLIIVFLFFPTVLLYQNFTDPIYWLVEFAVVGVILLFLRYYPSTNNIEINSNDKTIKINSNNLIGKYIIPKIDIPFNDFTEFSFKAKSIKGGGMTNHFNRIYICYSGHTRSLIDLPDGPFYNVNHRVFMDCLTRIIKNGA
jgi:hypothetical protein